MKGVVYASFVTFLFYCIGCSNNTYQTPINDMVEFNRIIAESIINAPEPVDPYITNIAKIDNHNGIEFFASKFKRGGEYDSLGGGLGVRITDINGKTYKGEHFWVEPKGIEYWSVIKVQPIDEPWEKYLWLDDLKKIEKEVVSEPLRFKFFLRNGKIIQGTWLRGVPGVHHSDWPYQPMICWYTPVGDDYFEFKMEVTYILSVELSSNNNDKDIQYLLHQKDEIKQSDSIIVTTTQGQIKTSGYFLAMTGSRYSQYFCYHYLYNGGNVDYFPEKTDLLNLSGGDIRHVSKKEIATIEFVAKPYLDGVKILKKDGQMVSGYIVSPGESYWGYWTYRGMFGDTHRLVCSQDDCVLLIPFKAVKKIEWK